MSNTNCIYDEKVSQIAFKCVQKQQYTNGGGLVGFHPLCSRHSKYMPISVTPPTLFYDVDKIIGGEK